MKRRPDGGKRAFQGLAGSPLAKATRGRPRKWPDDAARKRAERKAVKENVSDVPAAIQQWNERLAVKNLSADRGAFLAEAPHAKGKIIYNNELIASVPTPDTDPDTVALAERSGESPNRHLNGRRTGPADAEKVKPKKETEDQFHHSHPYPKNGKYPGSPAKARSVKAVECKQHSPRYRDEQGNEHAEPMRVVSRKYWVVTLECGCVRDVTPKKAKTKQTVQN